ncbi:MAG TPA: efflux RND transporter periplasmic adaptor subunit, partial [Longimicrobiales bacterium]|nr:efflux RND transporter periplasmic adaptor subunit [Longimicrobiales bacterium]
MIGNGTDRGARGAPWADVLRRHWLVTAIAAVVLLVVVVTVLRRRGGGEEAEAAPVVTAETAIAQVKPFPLVLTALGTVAARPGHMAALAAPAATRVSKIYVAVGDRVAAGQPLVALDETVFGVQSEQARAAYDAAREANDRARRLVAEGIAPRKDQEQAAAELAQARANLEAARHTQALGVLRSPIAGIVTEVSVALAAPVDVNQPVVQVVDPEALETIFHLSPGDAGRVAPGAAVELTSAQDSAHASLGRGRVTGVSATVDSATGSVAVRATIASPVRPLKVGETVSGALVVAVHPRAVVVPADAIVPAGGAAQVFVVDAQKVAHATPVSVGARTGGEVEVRSGLRGGEVVVTRGAYGVA